MDLIELGEDDRGALATWCSQRLGELDSSLGPIRSKFDLYLNAYNMIRKEEVKTFPWENASNIKSPDTLRTIITTAAHIHSSVWGEARAMLVKSFLPKYDDTASALEAFLDFYMNVVQKQSEYWRTHLPYWALLGTNITKLNYHNTEKDPWPTVSLTNIPIWNFYIYPKDRDIKKTTFCGHASYVHVKDLPDEVDAETRRALESYAYPKSGTRDEIDVESSDVDLGVNIAPGYLVLHDLYLTYKFDSEDTYRDIRVVFHKDSSTVVWVESWDADKRPYVVSYFRPNPDSFFGYGIGKAILYLQDGLDTAINQLIDNGSVVNAKMMKKTRTAGLDDSEDIFPGKIFTVRDINGLEAMSLGDINPGAFRTVTMIKELLESGAMVGENYSGLDSSITRSRQTFGGQALNVTISAQLQDFNAIGYYKGLEEIAWETLNLLAIYNPEFNWKDYVVTYENRKLSESQASKILPQNDLDELEKDITNFKERKDSEVTPAGQTEELSGAESNSLDYVLQARLSPEEADLLESNVFIKSVTRNRTLFELQTSKRTENKQIARQSAMILSQIVKQYLGDVVNFAAQIVQLKQQPGTELAVGALVEAWQTANKIMKKVLATYSVEDADSIILSLKEVENAGSELVTQSAPGPVGTPPPGNGQGDLGPNNPRQLPAGSGTLGGAQGLVGGINLPTKANEG